MRIVSRRELMSLPPGTLYHEWEPCYFKHLCIKGDTIPADDPKGYCGDWFQVDIPSLDVHSLGEDTDTQFAMGEDSNMSRRLDFETSGREALFDDALKYAVWERQDVIDFVERLRSSKLYDL